MVKYYISREKYNKMKNVITKILISVYKIIPVEILKN